MLTELTKRTNVVVIPTLNEAENLRILLPQLLALDVDILVVDDASNDGTAGVAHDLDDQNGRIEVLSRPSKLGLGSAYLQGFERSLSRGYTKIIQMDADGSHRVQDLEEMLKKIDGSEKIDLVIGSRWVPGGQVVNWPKYREVLSRVANTYSKRALGTSVRDMTAGFRIYRSEILQRMELGAVESEGYSFQIEMTREALRVGARVEEIPIVFIERIHGKSKMSLGIVFEAIFKVTKWGLMRKLPLK